MPDPDPQSTGGSGLVQASIGAAALLALTGAAAAAQPEELGILHAVVSGALFGTGVVAYLWAYLLGISRSRAEMVTMAGLFFLSGDAAPVDVRRRLRLATLGQVVIVVAAASARPYTEVAYGILAPMFGMGVMALWGGRHGSFPERAPRS